MQLTTLTATTLSLSEGHPKKKVTRRSAAESQWHGTSGLLAILAFGPLLHTAMAYDRDRWYKDAGIQRSASKQQLLVRHLRKN